MPEFELSRDGVLSSFRGFGVQLNHHTFAPMTLALGVPEASLPDLKAKVRALAPHLVRVFWDDKSAGVPFDTSRRASAVNVRQTPEQAERWASFVETVQLAQSAGAAINVTWLGGRLDETRMKRFANVLERLVGADVRNLRWATIANEPNTPPDPENPPDDPLTPERLGAMYRILHRELVRRGIRGRIGLMGGDLIEGPESPHVDRLHEASPFNQLAWFEHIVESRLDDVLDAYSVHIYWNYDPTGREGVQKFERRLREVRRVVDHLGLRKPLFVTEFGVRGKDRDKERGVNPGNFHGREGVRVPISHTRIAPFQHAWFMIRAAQLGYAGMVKWDCYFGKYDLAPPPKGLQQFYAIGPPVGPAQRQWEPMPVYHLLRLFTATTARGWKVRAVTERRKGTKHVVALEGPAGQLTLLGLDDRGALDDAPSADRATFRIGGLQGHDSFRLLCWNLRGGGMLRLRERPVAVVDGIATVTVPVHAVFALTTKKKLPPL